MGRYSKIGVPRHRLMTAESADRLEKAIETTERQAGKQEIQTQLEVDRADLLRCADQAQAHGKLSTAEWYRAYAHHGRPIGDKPDETGRQCGPQS